MKKLSLATLLILLWAGFAPAQVSPARPTLSTAQTFTNKRITKRVVALPNNDATLASSNTEYNVDNADMFTISALAQGTDFGVPGGTPTNGQVLTIRILDDGTSRALTWNAVFRAGTDATPLPAATTLGKTMYLVFIYHSTHARWDFQGKNDGFTTP